MNDLIIERIQLNQIENVVLIHQYAFKDFFLTSLGNGFLSIYYSSVLKHPSGLVLGCFNNEKLLGFAVVTKLSKNFHFSIMASNFLSFTKCVFKIIVKKPSSIYRLYKNFTKSNPAILDTQEYAELLSIAVSPEAQGKGVGKLLLENMEFYLRKKNVQKLSLTTDYYENEGPIEFYKKAGYEIFYDFIAYPNRRMYRMIKKIN